MNKFFIFTRGRTGSTAIIDELNSHSECKCHGEIFCRDPLSRSKYKRQYEERGQEFLREIRERQHDEAIPYHLWKLMKEETDRSLKGYLAYLEDNTRESGATALGFKLLHNQVGESKDDTGKAGLGASIRRLFRGQVTGKDDLLELLHTSGYKAIHLMRKNVVRQVVSGLLARSRGVYNSRKPTASDVAFHVDVDELKSRIEINLTKVALAARKLEDHGFDVINVYYEEFVNDRHLFHERLAEAVGIPSGPVRPTSFQVMVPEDLSAVITNYNEFVKQVDSMGLGDLIR